MSVWDDESPSNLEVTMRTVAGLFVGGVALVVLLKLLLLPLVGLFFGLIALAIKLAIVVAVGYFVYSLVRNRKHEMEA